MTADEMFKKLGYEKLSELELETSEAQIAGYTKEIKIDNMYYPTYIKFIDTDGGIIQIVTYRDDNKSCFEEDISFLSIDEIHAIYKKADELCFTGMFYIADKEAVEAHLKKAEEHIKNLREILQEE